MNIAKFIVSGFAISASIIAFSIATGKIMEAGSDFDYELPGVVFVFLLIILPFVMLPVFRVLSNRALFGAFVSTLIFWALFLLFSKDGDANIGLIFFMISSPVFVILVALAVDRFLHFR